MLRNYRYSSVAIGLHWAIAVGIIGMIFMGWYMGDLPNDAPGKSGLYQLHKSLGITILVLSIARLIWRFMNPPPEEPPMPVMQQRAAEAVHVVFYVLMITLPLSGWILVSASTRGLPTLLFGTVEWPHIWLFAQMNTETKAGLYELLENAHGKQAWIVIVLLVLHVGGAVKHQFLDKDRLMARMVPGVFGDTNGPERKPKGALVAFGGAAAFFLAVLGLGAMMGGPATAEPATNSASTEYKANWAINDDASSITVSGVYADEPFSLAFDEWSSKILFDPDAPAGAQIQTTIDMASARVIEAANESYVKSSLKLGDFLDAGDHPQSTFSATGVFVNEETGNYEVTAVLNFKGVDYPLRMPFTLDITDGKAVMDATVELNRIDMKVGLVNDPGADYIAETITVNVHVEATKAE